MQLHINSDSVRDFTKVLQQMHKSAFPMAVRGTLNDAVYNVKTDTMPKKAAEFKKRSPNFFKANSKFEKAEGFNVNSMKATVGFFENKLANASTNYAVKDLEQQEFGGPIKNKTFIAQKGARVNNKMVRANARMDAFKGKAIQASSHGKTRTGKSTTIASKKQQYIRAAIEAEKLHGENAFVIGGKNANGNRTLSKINFIRSSGRFTKGKYNLEINRTPLYSVKKGRVIPVKAKNFMKRATMETALNLNRYYITQAQKQFEKFKK
jgi:hypothetical protein